MTTEEIGARLVALCSAGQFDEAYWELFATDATSTEPSGEMVTGLTAMYEKLQKFTSENRISDLSLRGPFVAGDAFVVHFSLCLTPQGTCDPVPFEEVGLYTVDNGKVASEWFLYR